MKNNAGFLRFLISFRLALLAGVVLALLTTPANANVLELSFSPMNNVAAGSTNNGFDVLLTNTSGPSVAIDGFFFEILSSSSAVTFTSATTGTTVPYVFGSNSLLGPDILGPGGTPQDLRASDLDAIGGISMAPGVTLGLGHILFSVSPTASTQLVNFTYAGFPATSLADDLGNNVPISTSVGVQFTIGGSNAAVAEPSSLILLLTTMPLALVGRKRLR